MARTHPHVLTWDRFSYYALQYVLSSAGAAVAAAAPICCVMHGNYASLVVCGALACTHYACVIWVMHTQSVAGSEVKSVAPCSVPFAWPGLAWRAYVLACV